MAALYATLAKAGQVALHSIYRPLSALLTTGGALELAAGYPEGTARGCGYQRIRVITSNFWLAWRDAAALRIRT
jgi:hypothetical protein